MLHRSGRTGRAGKKGVSALLVPYTARAKALRLIRGAGVDARWTAAPSADEIRALDRERLLASFHSAEPASAEEEQMAEALLGSIGPAAVATALVRMARARLPEPEELFDPGPSPEERAPRGPRPRHERDNGRDNGRDGDRTSAPHGREHRDAEGSGDMVWFRLSVGRQKNADPKWLLPLICRRGHVTRAEIGAIRIFERESRFEIAAAAADRFTEALKRTMSEEIRIEPTDDDGAFEGRREQKPRGAGKPPRRSGFKPKHDRKPDRKPDRTKG